jgi:hypothetical protein
MKPLATLFLALSMAGCGLLGIQTEPAKVDQLLGLFIAYSDVQDPTPEMQAELITAALGVVGVDAAALDGVTPTASNLAAAAKLVEKYPDLATFEPMLAKLINVAIYGVPQ